MLRVARAGVDSVRCYLLAHSLASASSIKFGDPSALEDYQGGRDFDRYARHVTHAMHSTAARRRV